MKELERFKELESLLTRECGKYEKDCTTCPYQKECGEYGDSELINYNSMCIRCKKFLNGCPGETSKVFTGCVRREI